MFAIVVTFLLGGYALAWSGFGKVATGGSSAYSLTQAFNIFPGSGNWNTGASLSGTPTVSPIAPAGGQSQQGLQTV